MSFVLNSARGTEIECLHDERGRNSDTLCVRKALLRRCRCIEIDVWDGEARSHLDESKSEEKKHRFRPHVPKAFAGHRHSKDTSEAEVVQPPSEDESVSMPAPWTSATTATRAEPRVLHGHTLTREVPFRDVCVAVRDTAFITRCGSHFQYQV